MVLEYSFNNPFSEYNANVMDSQTILNYWCSPLKFSATSESDIFVDKMPLFFMGGRGSGKTMFFKYFSYKTQKEEAKKLERRISEYLHSKGGVGFYLRIDGPDLRSFQGSELNLETWNALFGHYFALQICKSYLEIIADLMSDGEINKEAITTEFIPAFIKFLGREELELDNIDQLMDIINNALRNIASFRSKISFSETKFHPSIVLPVQDLIFESVAVIKNTISELRDINFIIFIDEYENFSIEQQKLVNTLIKFVRPGVTFRIGMRLEGFRTYDTISEDEFILEGRDYRKEVFEGLFLKDINGYRHFLFDVAKKRLESVPEFRQKGFINISEIFGDSEDLEQEAREIVKNRDRHFGLLKHADNKFEDEVINEIRNPDNPLLEMWNILWVIRGFSPEEVGSIMKQALNGENVNDKNVKKYKDDFVNKYKWSLTVLLASLYRKNKKYYSFNTFSFLSSGIIGNFLELCRRSLQHAYFEDPESVYCSGKVDKSIQDKAARDLASFQLDNYKRIPKYGQKVTTLAVNLGNIFREYHMDVFVRYPETNQFYVDLSSEDEDITSAFSKAIEWTIIQKKDNPQSATPGTEKQQLYFLNKVFSPLFNISYRTRGGVNYTVPDLKSIMNSEVEQDLQFEQRRRKKTKLEEFIQPKLF